MNIQEYIESGVLELYVLGSATEAETEKVLFYKERYPEVEKALYELETDMERVAQHMAIQPPPGLWDRIEDNINGLIEAPEYEPVKFKPGQKQNNGRRKGFTEHFIEVEAESAHMRLHKNWRWVFAAVFVLGKIFLGFAIYFYLENRQAQEQIQDLKTEIRQLHKP